MRERRKGGRGQQACEKDSSATASCHTTDDRDSKDEVWHQRAGVSDDTDGATVPPLAVTGAKCGREGGAFGGQWRWRAESLCSAITPVVMVAAEALRKTPGGGQV